MPIAAWYAQVGYFVTGERVVRRDVVQPTRNFDLRRGRLGPGAIETTFRFNTFHLGRSVFTGGLADPTAWTNDASTVDLGVNWYWNRYIKVIFDYQHATFGSPVQFAANHYHDSGDSYFLRFQVNY